MPQYTPEQRKAYAEHLHALIREWIERGDGFFEIELRRGVEWCSDARTQEPLPRANPTMTLVLKINGGAEDNEGPPVLPAPEVFHGPEA